MKPKLFSQHRSVRRKISQSLKSSASGLGTSLVVQWLRPHSFTAEDLGSILVGGQRFHKLHRVAKKKKRISHMKLIIPGSLIFPSTRSTPSAYKGAPSSSHLTESLFHSTWRRKWQPTSVFLPGESQGQGSLAGCSPWGHKESDVT